MKFNVNSTKNCNSTASEGYITPNSNNAALMNQRISIPCSNDAFLMPSKPRMASYQNSPASYHSSPASYQQDNSPVDEVHSAFTEAANSGYSHLMTPDREDEDVDMDSQLDADVEAIMSKLYLIEDDEADDDDNSSSSNTAPSVQRQSTNNNTPNVNWVGANDVAADSNVSNNGNVNNKKKRKKRSKSVEKEGISYHPPKQLRAQGNIQISKSLTDTIIPQRIAEDIKEVYQYMDKITAINCFENDMDLDLDANAAILVFNYGFHDRDTQQLLYTVAEKQDITNNKSRGYKWKMVNDLFTAQQLEQLYQVPANGLPKLFRACSRFACSVQNDETLIRQHLQSAQFVHTLIQKVQWHKTEVFHRVNNKRRMTLSLTKPEFMQRMTDCVKMERQEASTAAQQEDGIQLIPILLFNNVENTYLIEYVWIVHLEPGIDIGISFKYNATNGVRVTGIHLDGEYIKAQHQLIYPNHTLSSLESFTSNITNLAIGNPDDNLNKIKYYKQQIDEMTVYRESLKRILNSEASHREAVIQDLVSKTNLADNNHRHHHHRGYNYHNNRPLKMSNNVAKAQHLAAPQRTHSGRSIVSDLSRDSSRSYPQSCSPPQMQARVQQTQMQPAHSQQMQLQQLQQQQLKQQQLQQQLLVQQQQQQQYELMQQQRLAQQMAYQRQQEYQRQQQQKQLAEARSQAQFAANYQYLQQQQMYPQYTHSQ